MKSNPGGQIDVKAAIGRDRLIKTLWEAIEQQSLIITAERRIGKTTVIKKMQAQPLAGWVPVYQDLEGFHTATEFAMSVYKEIHEFLGAKGKVTRRAKEWFSAMGGSEIGGLFKLPEKANVHWKDVLTCAIEDLINENEANGTRLLFLWDEMPYLLANIVKREGEQTAMEVLDLLRALRQTHASLRMVITGSIGLHHVLATLKTKNYSNSPVNDMLAIEVPPLDDADAITLATQLIGGESLESPDVASAAAALAHAADCFPFYIHHIVKALKITGLAANPANVAKIVASHLVDAKDPWELLHYRTRIPNYYLNDQKSVLLLLDQLATQADAASVNGLLAMLKGASGFDDRERLLHVLSLMERDHYLKRDDGGGYRFRFPLISRWWKINRGL